MKQVQFLPGPLDTSHSSNWLRTLRSQCRNAGSSPARDTPRLCRRIRRPGYEPGARRFDSFQGHHALASGFWRRRSERRATQFDSAREHRQALFWDRLRVGHEPLDLVIVVRIHGPELREAVWDGVGPTNRLAEFDPLASHQTIMDRDSWCWSRSDKANTRSPILRRSTKRNAEGEGSVVGYRPRNPGMLRHWRSTRPPSSLETEERAGARPAANRCALNGVRFDSSRLR